MRGYEIRTHRWLLMRNIEVHSNTFALKSRKKLSKLDDSEKVILATNICTDSTTCISDDVIDEKETSKESLSGEIEFVKTQLAEKDYQLLIPKG